MDGGLLGCMENRIGGIKHERGRQLDQLRGTSVFHGSSWEILMKFCIIQRRRGETKNSEAASGVS